MITATFKCGCSITGTKGPNKKVTAVNVCDFHRPKVSGDLEDIARTISLLCGELFIEHSEPPALEIK